VPRLVKLVGLLLIAAPLGAGADTIVLTNGRTIEVDRTWVQGSQLLYERNGGTFGVPRSLVSRVDQRALPEAVSDPDIAKARARLAAGDPVEATRLLNAAVARDPGSVPALQALTQAYLKLGDARAAQATAERALKLDTRNPTTLALNGDAFTALADRAGAEAEYRKSLQLRADSDVQRKLADVTAPPAQTTQGPVFRVRYDGSVNEPLGIAVLQSLSEAYKDYARRLGGSPGEPITVTLQTERRFDDERVPEWAEGVNDGTIRVPVHGLTALTPRLTQVLRHELAHSFIAFRTGGNCPTWLQEGIAQWLEGGDSMRGDAMLAAAAREQRLLPLVTLEGPFDALSENDAILAYAQSLSAVAYIVRRSGEAGIVRLLSALGDRLPSEEALPVALAISYPELQKGWSEQLGVAKLNAVR
jgi:tetratricopeptide (TPR) repeat protein